MYNDETMEASVVTLNLRLQAATKRDGNIWIAHCLPLDVYSQGDTKEKALASLTEAVHLWFESCLDRDVLSEALAESGFTKVKVNGPVPDGASVVQLLHSKVPAHSKTSQFIEVQIPAYVAAHLNEVCAIR